MSPFIFAIVNMDGEQTVAINTKQYWKDNKCLTDGYSEPESEVLELLLEKVQLCSYMESMFLLPIKWATDDATLKQKLIDAGLDFDPKFQKWMKTQI